MVFERLKRGLRMDLESLRVLKAHPRLMVLPLLSAILIVAVWAATFLPLFLAVPDLFDQQGILLVTGLALYFASFFVAFIFEAALIDAAADHFRGDPVSIKASLKEVWGRKSVIFVWAVIAGTVGLILRVLSQRAGILGRIVLSIVGMVWNLATLLVLPTLVYEDVGAWQGLKRSAARFKEHWGEVTTGSLAMGALFYLLGFGAFVVGILLLFALASALGTVGLVVGVVLFVTLLVVVALAGQAAHGILVGALYTYIDTGEVPSAYTREYIERPYTEG